MAAHQCTGTSSTCKVVAGVMLPTLLIVLGGVYHLANSAQAKSIACEAKQSSIEQSLIRIETKLDMFLAKRMEKP